MSGFPGDFSEPLIGENEEMVADAIRQDEERLGRPLSQATVVPSSTASGTSGRGRRNSAATRTGCAAMASPPTDSKTTRDAAA
jgi:hypothetical protein